MPEAGEISEQLLGAMLAKEPVPPVGWAIQRKADGTPLYLVAYVLGPENVEKFAASLTKLRPGMDPVPPDFDGSG